VKFKANYMENGLTFNVEQGRKLKPAVKPPADVLNLT